MRQVQIDIPPNLTQHALPNPFLQPAFPFPSGGRVLHPELGLPSSDFNNFCIQRATESRFLFIRTMSRPRERLF